MELYHLTVFLRCICKKDQFFASVVRCPDDQLLMISAWEWHPEICGVWGLLEGLKWHLRYSGYDFWYGRLVHHFREAVSMLTDVPVGETSLERQSAALFLAPEIHLKVILYVVSSRLHLITLFNGVLAIKESC